MTLKRVLLFSCLIGSLFSLEIYNFPDLADNISPELTLDEIEEIVERDFTILTNENAYNLEQLAIDNENETLKAALTSRAYREYISDPDKYFAIDELSYDQDKRRALAEVRESLTTKFLGRDAEGNRILGLQIGAIESKFRLFGKQNISLGYGQTWSFNEGEELDNRRFKNGRVGAIDIKDGFVPELDLNLTLQGQIGRKVFVEVNYSTQNRNNTYKVEYRGDEDDVIKNVKFGQVDLSAKSKSQFLTAGGVSKKVIGVRMEGEKRNFSFMAAAGISRGLTAVQEIDSENVNIRDIDYIRNRFFKLPETNVNTFVSWHLYEEISDEFASIANLSLTNGVDTIYFRQVVDDVSFRIDDQSNVIVDVGSIRANTYTLLFYTYKTNNAFTVTASTATNKDVFFNGYGIDMNPLTGAVSSNFAVLNVKQSDLASDKLPNYYEQRNHYFFSGVPSIPSWRMRLLNSSQIEVDAFPWIGGKRHKFEKGGVAVLESEKGYFYFESERPMTNYAGYSNEFTDGIYDEKEPYDQANDNNNVNFKISYELESLDFIRLDHPNVIRGSIVVKRAGRVLNLNEDYTVNYAAGLVFLNNDDPLQKGEKLTIVYEYQPFGFGLQRILANSRFDYLIRGDSYVGGGVGFSMGIPEGEGSPDIGRETSLQIVGGVDTKLDLISLANRRRYNDYKLELEGEYAFSIFNPNLKKFAIIDNMSDGETFTPSGSFQNYYLTHNPSIESGDFFLTRSYFTDFNTYGSISQNRTRVDFTLENEKDMQNDDLNGNGAFRDTSVNFRPYSVRPGPFQVSGEGHLDPDIFVNQSSVIFDLDFNITNDDGSDPGTNASSLGYVSFITKPGFNSLKNAEQLEITYKILPSYDRAKGDISSIDPSVIGFSIDVGQLNEDLDGDGSEDEEPSLNDVDGFVFNYTNGSYGHQTKLGGGWKGWNSPSGIEVGNNKLDKEDINQDNIFRTEDINLVTFPSDDTIDNPVTNFFYLFSQNYFDSNGIDADSFISNGAQYADLGNATVTADDYQDASYYKMTIPLNQANTNSAIETIEHLRLNFFGIGNKTGRVIIESIKFKSSRWSETTVDGNQIDHNTQFSGFQLSTSDDNEYKNNNLARQFEKTYERLNGTLNNRDLRRLEDNTMSLDFKLNGTANTGSSDSVNGQLGLIERKNAEKADVTKYRLLKFFTYVVEKTDTEDSDFIFRFGKDEFNHFEMRVPVDTLGSVGSWVEYAVRMRGKNKSQREEMQKNAYSGDHYFFLERRTSDDDNDGTLLNFDEYTIKRIGVPSLQELTYYALGVENTNNALTASGRIWVNEIHVAEDQWLFGQAYRASLNFSKDKPIRIRDFALFRDINSRVSYRYVGLNFSELDQESSGGVSHEYAWNSSFQFVNALDVNFDLQDVYDISDSRETYVPKENQKVRKNSSGSLALKMSLPKIVGKIIPDVSHTFKRSVNQSMEFENTSTNTNIASENDKEVRAINQVSRNRSYFFKEEKKYNFTKDISWNQSYENSTSFVRSETLSTNVLLGDVTVTETSLAQWYNPFMNKKKVNPVWSLFETSDEEDIRTKSNLLDSVEYTFRREQKVKTGFKLWTSDVDFSFTKGYSHTLKFTNIENAIDIDSVNKQLDKGNFIEEFSSIFRKKTDIFQDQEKDAFYNDLSRKYIGTYSLNQQVPFGIGQFNRFSFLMSYEYNERNFDRPEAKSFDHLELVNFARERNVDDITAFSNAAFSVEQDFYTASNEYRDIENIFSWNIDIPFEFKDFLLDRFSQFSFGRTLKINENDVFNGDPNKLKALIPKKYHEDFLGAYGEDQKVNLQTYYWKKALQAFYGDGNYDAGDAPQLMQGLFPYMGMRWVWSTLFGSTVAPFMSMRGDSNKKIRLAYTRLKHWYRIAAAESLEKAGDNVDRRESTSDNDQITKFTSHNEFNSRIERNDNFNLRVTPLKIKYLDYLLPEDISYNARLNTIKEKSILTQTENRSISLRKEFERFNDFINKKLPGGKGFTRRFSMNMTYSFEEERNYNFKEITRIHGLGLVTDLKRLTRKLDLTFKYDFRVQAFRQHLRYRWQEGRDRDEKYSDYLGIGDPSVNGESKYGGKKTSIQSLTGYDEWLNVGALEDSVGYLQTTDIAGEKSDLNEFIHLLTMVFSWKEDRPLLFKRLAKKGKRVPESKQSVQITYLLNHYRIPGLNKKTTPFNDSDVESPVDAKNLASINASFIRNGAELTLWGTAIKYENTFVFNNGRVTLGFNVALALQKIGSYTSYQQYLFRNAPPAQINTDSVFEFFQLGFQAGLTGSLIF